MGLCTALIGLNKTQISCIHVTYIKKNFFLKGNLKFSEMSLEGNYSLHFDREKKKKQAIYNYSARKINRASEAESHRVVLVFNRVTREGLVR